MISRQLRLFSLTIVTLLISACGTTAPTKFYTLSPEITEQAQTATSSNKIIVGVGPVEVAPYLERNQIVTRTGITRLNLTEFNHWAAPIENNIANVLAVNLSRLLPHTQPIARPWSDAGTQYHVLIKVLQFDSDGAGNVQLKANWGIQLSATQNISVIREANIMQASVGEDYEAITRNMSTALATLSEQIALALEKMIQAEN